MLKKLLCVDKLFTATIISLLICAIFLAYYSVDYTMDAYKSAAETGNVSRDTYPRTGSRTANLRFANNKLVDSEQEEFLSDKVLSDNHDASFEKKWVMFCLYIFSYLILASFALYIKGWFVKVTHSNFQFHQVHFIQLKDGKKSALSYR